MIRAIHGPQGPGLQTGCGFPGLSGSTPDGGPIRHKVHPLCRTSGVHGQSDLAVAKGSWSQDSVH